ncbi:O-antigen ligase domain-containing protein [Brunnivagina elsteri]|uniref:O-antigen ligase domain-containing protein n=1 Tax=Brunnivagina elsteri TaxID=1247191 RepID=UPI001FE2F4F5|nr:O-antigen ligase domain-containing protein [Calothrix elsteri]
MNSTNKQQNSFLGWLAIGALILFSAATIAAGMGSLFRPGYIVLSFAVGVLLYCRYPILYMGFTWWIWFLTPLISRLIDWRSNFDESRLILVSQYLVTLITMHAVIKYLPKSYRQGGLPFILAFIGVFYGFLIGVVKTSPFTAARSLLDWLIPISFSFYIFMNWRDYPQYRQNIQRVFLWGVLITGAYGVIQYLIAPDWDRFWLISTKLTSMGEPEPLKIRVWSTMASTGPFSCMMMAGLLLLFNGKGPLCLPAAGAGYLAFLLSMARTMWGSWVVGLLGMITSIRPKLQMRLMVSVLLMALCVLPLSTMEPFAGTINARLQTLTNLDNDNSANVRQKIYEQGLNSALTNSLGNGIGNTFAVNEKGILVPIVIDSGILDTFFTLGWFGALPYIAGLVLMLSKLLQMTDAKRDPFMAVSRSICIACIASLPIGSTMLGFSGMFLWGFGALALAADQNYQQQRFEYNLYQEYIASQSLLNQSNPTTDNP